jgi:hypothetical protein
MRKGHDRKYHHGDRNIWLHRILNHNQIETGSRVIDGLERNVAWIRLPPRV